MVFRTKRWIWVVISSLIIFLGIGTIFYHQVESWNWIDSFYFSVTTLSTVGYGDLKPTTNNSKLFTSVYILFGVGVMLASLAIIGSKYLERKDKEILRLRRMRIRRSLRKTKAV